jgi:ABC-type transport system substrate-binding protein
MRSFFTPWAQTIKVIDAYTVQTTSKKPLAPILRFLAHPSMAFVSPAALEKYGDQVNRNPVGTGPYRFVEWKAGQRIVLERYDDFWGPKPKIKRIESGSLRRAAPER